MSDLLNELLAVPTAPRAARKRETEFTSKFEISDGSATAELRGAVGTVDESAAYELLKRKGENPDDWVVVGYRSSEWTMANGDLGESNRYSFARRGTRAAQLADQSSGSGVAMDELLAIVDRANPAPRPAPEGDHAFVVALGDMQFGKHDGDGAEGTLRRTLDCLERAAALVPIYRERFPIGHIHVAWLGDHIEGFTSQGGANVWRTPLTLNEQIRLTRRVMLRAVELFAPLAPRVSMAAVPGNHGEPQRFSGKGVTRYDDSHDTEALIAVGEALDMNPNAFDHVEIYVPETDEMTVVLDLAGTTVGHVHGHQWRPGKAESWWQGQAFGGSPLADADVLLAGHLHHLHVEDFGKRMFIQVPSMESESTWFKHAKGVPGNPGLVTFITKDGQVPTYEVVRGHA